MMLPVPYRCYRCCCNHHRRSLPSITLSRCIAAASFLNDVHAALRGDRRYWRPPRILRSRDERRVIDRQNFIKRHRSAVPRQASRLGSVGGDPTRLRGPRNDGRTKKADSSPILARLRARLMKIAERFPQAASRCRTSTSFNFNVFARSFTNNNNK